MPFLRMLLLLAVTLCQENALVQRDGPDCSATSPVRPLTTVKAAKKCAPVPMERTVTALLECARVLRDISWVLGSLVFPIIGGRCLEAKIVEIKSKCTSFHHALISAHLMTRVMFYSKECCFVALKFFFFILTKCWGKSGRFITNHSRSPQANLQN